MYQSGFADAPVTRLLILSCVVNALLVSLTDSKYYLPILVEPHLWTWGQWWRTVTWQLAYTNSAEVLCASIGLYEMRVVERVWGSRKFASFLAVAYLYIAFVVPTLLALILRPLTLHKLNYLPSGQTALFFSLLSVYHSIIPSTYHYKIGLSQHTNPDLTVTFTSKTLSYFLPLQLTVSQIPYSILPAAVGWIVGSLLQNKVVPGSAWRIPFFHTAKSKTNVTVEGLRRRLESERSGVGFSSAIGDEPAVRLRDRNA